MYSSTSQPKSPRGAVIRIALSLVLFVLFAVTAAFSVTRLWPQAERSPGKSVAVLPFETSAGGEANRGLAESLHGDLLIALAGIADLTVISPASVLAYEPETKHRPATIGRDLQVAYLVEGTVRQAGSRIRLNIRLIDTNTESQVWARRYDHSVNEVFTIKARIAAELANELHARLSQEEKSALAQPPTQDLRAFELYHRARAVRFTANYGAEFLRQMQGAIDFLDEAVSRDPNFLLAWTELAMAHGRLYFAGYDHTAPRLALADRAVQRALALDPDSGAGHLALAQHLYNIYRDYDAARRELEIAHRTLPNSAEASFLSSLIDRREGRWIESIRDHEKAISLDPLNWLAFGQLAVTHFHVRNFADAATALDRALAIRPREPLTRISRAWVDYEARADLAPLHATVDAIVRDDPAAVPTIAADWLFLALCERDFAAGDRALAALKSDGGLTIGAVLLNREFGAGLLARERGDAAAATTAFLAARAAQEEQVRQQPDQAPPLCALGLIDAALGRKEDALRAGRRALELMPVERDALVGSDVLTIFSIICAWTGERDLALEYLRTSARQPSMVSYGKLRKHPWWTPLWGDPAYEQIVAELAPPLK